MGKQHLLSSVLDGCLCVCVCALSQSVSFSACSCLHDPFWTRATQVAPLEREDKRPRLKLRNLL